MPLLSDEEVERYRTTKRASGPTTSGVVEDVAKGAGSGLARGVVGLPGMPADLASLGMNVLGWVGRQLTGEDKKQFDERMRASGNWTPEAVAPYTSEGVINAVSENVGGGDVLQYEPKTGAGRIAQVTGEFVGGAAPTAGAGAWLKAGTRAEKVGALAKELIAQGVAPGVASEAAGQAADKYLGADYGTAVRLATGLATSLAGGVAHNVTGPPRTVNVPGVGDVRSTAARNVGREIASSGGPQAIAGQLDEVGQGGRLADATPGMRGQAEQLYIQPGSSQGNIRQFMNERIAGLRGSRDTALTRTLDTIINPRSANFADETAAMRQARAARADDLYGEARRMTANQPIDVSRFDAYADTLRPPPTPGGPNAYPLRDYERTIIDTAERLRARNDFDFVFAQKRDLDNEITRLTTAGENVPQPLRDAQRMLDQSLENATRRPDNTSVYGEARRAYREDSGILDAHGTGRRFFDSKETSDDFAVRWRDMTDMERQAERLGLREAIGAKMDINSNDFNSGVNALRTNNATEKLRIILGNDATEQLQQRLTGLMRQRGTVQGIENQSATAGRLRGRETITDPEAPAIIPNLSRVQGAPGAAALATETVANRMLAGRHRAAADVSNLDQARILTQDLDQLPPAERMAMLQRLYEVNQQYGQRGLPANRMLLGLQALYQANRSEENQPMTLRVRPPGERN